MSFFCQQCGECCSHMGQIHRIGRQVSEYGYELRNVYGGECALVRIDPDKITLYEDRSIFAEWPEACPFLRKDLPRKKIVCTIHHTRPDLCREFGCWRLLIIDPAGNRAGRIMGTRHLSAEDPALFTLWAAETADIGILDDDSWDRELIRILEAHGYRVINS
jgi:hypothetical protein